MTRPLHLRRLDPALVSRVRAEAGDDLGGWISDAIRDAADAEDQPARTGPPQSIVERIDDEAWELATSRSRRQGVSRAEWIRWAMERALARLEP